jgi:hypothetical protein
MKCYCSIHGSVEYKDRWKHFLKDSCGRVTMYDETKQAGRFHAMVAGVPEEELEL